MIRFPTLDAFSSYPVLTWLFCHAGRSPQQINYRLVQFIPLVQESSIIPIPIPLVDRVRTDLRRT